VHEVDSGLRLAVVDRAAAAAGLAPGLALADARAILPGLRTFPADPAGDARTLVGLVRWCRRYTPWVAVDPSGGGSLLLDVTGCAHLFGGEAGLLADLTGRLETASFAARAALADTAGAAWAVARYGDLSAPWSIVAPGGARMALAPLAVAALGLDPETVAGLVALGLGRIGDLLPLPRAALARRFGEGLAGRLDAALGTLAEPLSPARPTPAHAARASFPEPLVRTEDLATALAHLLDRLCAGLERAGAGARRLDLALVEPNGRAHSIAVGTSRPRRDPAGLARLFADRLDGIEAPFGVETMVLTAPATAPLAPVQIPIPSPLEGEVGPGVDDLLDRLGNKLGAANVLRFAARESHVPERAVRAVTVLDEAPPHAPQNWPDAKPFAQPRPLRLFSPPEPIEAMAPVPDDPPVTFRWRRALHRVARAAGPERIAPEWWRTDGKGAEIRDYYRVEDAAGRRFWVYRDGLYRPDAPPAWYMHGVFG
jgi:protein ImuB